MTPRLAAVLPDRDSTVAVVTTFHPGVGLIDRLTPVLRDVAKLLIVDNGSSSDELEEARALVTTERAEAVWNRKNLGLAAALDRGLEWASARGASWVLLLDQDTATSGGIVADAARVIAAAPRCKIAAVGAGIVGRNESSKHGFRWREEPVVITSGTVVSVDAWRAVGGFRGDFFVDYVDIEFCLRARASGYRIFRSLRPTIVHAIGHPERSRFLWRTVTLTNHPPPRRYSITRNRILIWRSYWRFDTRFVIADVWAFGKELVKVGLLEKDRRSKLAAVARGIGAGARTRTSR